MSKPRPGLEDDMREVGKAAVLSRDVRIVNRQEDSLLHNIANGAWCRISRHAADFFSKEGGVELAYEAARMGNGDAVGMLRLAAELADTGMLIPEGTKQEETATKVGKAYLIATRRCNLGCPQCYMGEAGMDDYPLSTVLEAAGSILKLNPASTYITGGEPCMRSDLGVIIRAFKGAKLVLCTNGTLPDRIPYALLKESGARLQVSLESCSEVAHDAIRGDGNHKLSSETVRRAASYGIEVEVVPTIAPGGGIEIEEMLNFAGSLGAGCHGSLMVSSGRASNERHKKDGELLASICGYLRKCVEKGEIEEDWDLEDIVPMLSRSTCGAGSRIVAFTGDGAIHPCHLLWDKPIDQEVLRRDVDLDGICMNCDVRYLCGGGCMAAAELNGGLDPNCGVYRAVYAAFAWKWDDSLTVSENMKIIGGDCYEMADGGAVRVQACSQA